MSPYLFDIEWSFDLARHVSRATITLNLGKEEELRIKRSLRESGKFAAIGSCVAGLLLAIGGLGSPALAAPSSDAAVSTGIQSVTNASGTRTCGPNQQVYLRMTLDGAGAATITKTGTGSYSVVRIGPDIYYVFGVSSTGWKVYAPPGIATISDGCVVNR